MRSPTSISVCTIVKNERDRIEDFLASTVDFADEIVVVDTGSTDDTPACVEAFIRSRGTTKIRLLKYVKTQGFHYGLAKNFSIDSATKDYVIILDADERLGDDCKEGMRDFIARESPVVASVVRRDDLLPHLVDYPERILLRASSVRYGIADSSKVHEQLVHDVPAKSFSGTIVHQQRWNHYVVRPQRILFQLELQVDRVPRTKSFLGHLVRGVWYFCYRFKKIYMIRGLYKDGFLGFKYAFIRALDAFLIELFVGLKPLKNERYWEEKAGD